MEQANSFSIMLCLNMVPLSNNRDFQQTDTAAVNKQISVQKVSKPGGNSRDIDGEMPTWKIIFDPVLKFVWKKIHLFWKNKCTRSLFFISRKVFRTNLTCSGIL